MCYRRRRARGHKAPGQLVDSSTDSSGSTRTASDDSGSQPATISSGGVHKDNLAYVEAMGEFATVKDTLTHNLASDQGSLFGTLRSVHSVGSFGTMDSNLKKGYFKATGSIGSLRSARSGTVASRSSVGQLALHSVVLEENVDATLMLERKETNSKLFQRFEDSSC